MDATQRTAAEETNRVEPQGSDQVNETPGSPSAPLKKPRRWTRRLVVGFALALVLVLFHEPLLRGLAGVLVKNDPVEAADAVVFMAASGPIQTLPFDELARLQHEGLASRILLIESRSSRIVKAGVVPTVESVLRRELGARRAGGRPGDSGWRF